MTYPQALNYLESLINYEKTTRFSYKNSFKLELFQEFLGSIGNPQRTLRCVHVAGSKGKGSTSAFIAYMLREAGCKVGLYTSPHLKDLRERIRILEPGVAVEGDPDPFEGMIGEDDFSRLATSLSSDKEKFENAAPDRNITFFEFCTAMAFRYFLNKRVDFCVLETGMGGRLDATNVVESVLCVLTPISYDHTQVLGRTLAEIAGEKAGIIKPALNKKQELNVISAPQMEPAAEVIRKRCSWTKARLWEIGQDIVLKQEGVKFSVKGRFGSYDDLQVRLPGRHQVVNACTAVAVVENLAHKYKIKADIDSLRRGLYNTLWPGRCEIISRDPLVILDGAHNKASAIALRETIQAEFSRYRLLLVLGISADKDIRSICRELVPLASKVIITKAVNPRACDIEVIEKEVRRVESNKGLVDIVSALSVKEAVNQAVQGAAADDLILVAGSLFLVSEARDVFVS